MYLQCADGRPVERIAFQEAGLRTGRAFGGLSAASSGGSEGGLEGLGFRSCWQGARVLPGSVFIEFNWSILSYLGARRSPALPVGAHEAGLDMRVRGFPCLLRGVWSLAFCEGSMAHAWNASERDKLIAFRPLGISVSSKQMGSPGSLLTARVLFVTSGPARSGSTSPRRFGLFFGCCRMGYRRMLVLVVFRFGCITTYWASIALYV